MKSTPFHTYLDNTYPDPPPKMADEFVERLWQQKRDADNARAQWKIEASKRDNGHGVALETPILRDPEFRAKFKKELQTEIRILDLERELQTLRNETTKQSKM